MPPTPDRAPEDGDRRELEARLNHLLTLASRLPAGTSEDSVRRRVCELIEAENPTRSLKVLNLMTSIAELQHARDLGLRRTQQSGVLAIDRLLTVLCEVATRTAQTPASTDAFDQGSWERWKARGRAEDLALRRKLRVVAITLAATTLVGAALGSFLIR